MVKRSIQIVLMVATAIIMGGCARLDYVKVPTPTQYSSWTDEQQQKADRMKGVRYYLPRPFLHLKQSAPVAQRVAFVSFRYDPNEKVYKLELPEEAPTWLKKIAPQRISVTQALAVVLAGERAQTTGPAQQSGEAGVRAETKAEAAPEGGQKPGPDTTATKPPPSELQAHTGFISDTDPVTRLGDRMDVVYLPDFEEQYVIQSRTGLGKGEIETRLRNGWAAEVFSQQLDNSNLIPYVIDQVSKTSEAAAGIFTTWAPVAAGLPPGTKLPSLPKLQAAKAGGEEGDRAKALLEDVLLFKIAEVKVAQPGLYPILKPREIKQWLRFEGVIQSDDSEAAFNLFLRQARVPWIRPDMAFIPCPPITMIGFNATTDVFIMPATNRITEPPSSEERLPRDGVESIKKIQTALSDFEKAKAALGIQIATKLSLGNVTVEGVDNNRNTKIQVGTKSAKLDPTEQKTDLFQKWMRDLLGLKSGEEKNVTVSFEPYPATGGTLITIIVPVPMKDLPKKKG